MNGVAAGTDNYESWLKRQDKAFQIEALGRGRYDLWKKEGIPLDRFTTQRNRPMTLDEIRKREGITA